MKARKDGSGTMHPTASGKWHVRVYRDGVRKCRTVATEAEAAALLAGWQDAAALGEVSGAAPTLGAWGETWLKGRTCRTAQGERSTWQAQVAPAPIARVHLDDLRRRHVLEFVAWLARRKATRPAPGGVRVEVGPLSWQSQKHALALVQRALQGAVDAELVAINVAAGVRLKKKDTIEDPWTFLTADEIAQVTTLPAPHRDLFLVAIYTGLRAGELWALRWEDCHLEGERPHLSVRRSHGGATKSGKPRTVPLLAPAQAALLRLRPDIAHGLVFPGQDGERHVKGYDGGWADTMFGPGWKARAGIARPVRFHDLRHTCASHLIQGTWGRVWALEEVRDFLGHSSITVTQRYAHLGERLHRAAASTLGGFEQTYAATGELPLTRRSVCPASARTYDDSNLRKTHRAALALKAAILDGSPFIVRLATELVAAVLAEDTEIAADTFQRGRGGR